MTFWEQPGIGAGSSANISDSGTGRVELTIGKRHRITTSVPLHCRLGSASTNAATTDLLVDPDGGGIEVVPTSTNDNYCCSTAPSGTSGVLYSCVVQGTLTAA